MVVQVLSRIVYAMYLINIILQATIYNNNVQLKRNSFAFVGKRIRTQRLIPLDAIRSRAMRQSEAHSSRAQIAESALIRSKGMKREARWVVSHTSIDSWNQSSVQRYSSLQKEDVIYKKIEQLISLNSYLVACS